MKGFDWAAWDELRTFDGEAANAAWADEVTRRVRRRLAPTAQAAVSQLNDEWAAYRISQFQIGQQARWLYRKDASKGTPFVPLLVTVVAKTDTRICISYPDHDGDIHTHWITVNRLSAL